MCDFSPPCLHLVLSIPAVCIYQGVFTILGGAFLFLTGVAYGLMNLGKKASREEMAEKARELDRDIDKLKLVFAEKKPATNGNNVATPSRDGRLHVCVYVCVCVSMLCVCDNQMCH